MAVKAVDLRDYIASAGKPGLEVVRLTANEMAMVPFFTQCETIDVHYCEEVDIRGYVPCAEEDCLLCQIGRDSEERLLMPVYLPISRSISVLSVSPSRRPEALQPQLEDIIAAGEPVALFVRKTPDNKFLVSTRPLTENMDGGEDAIRHFEEEYTVGTLASIYPPRSREKLAKVTEIANEMEFRGIEV